MMPYNTGNLYNQAYAGQPGVAVPQPPLALQANGLAAVPQTLGQPLPMGTDMATFAGTTVPATGQSLEQQLALLSGGGVAGMNALGAEASGLMGQAAMQGEPEPTTIFGKLKKNFFDVQTYAFLPSLFLMLPAFMKINVADPSAAASLPGWKKPFYHVGRVVESYDKGIYNIGAKISNFVKTKLGLNLSKIGFLNKIYEGKLWQWTAPVGAKGFKAKLLEFVGGAGRAIRNAGVRQVGGNMVAKFSLRSILTGLGMAGPLGWISLAAAAGLTLWSVLSGKKNEPANDNAAMQQQLMAQMPQGQVGQNAMMGGGAGLTAQAPYPAGAANPTDNPFAAAFGVPGAAPAAVTGANDYVNTINAINSPGGVAGGLSTQATQILGQQGQSAVPGMMPTPTPLGFAGDTSGFSPQTRGVIDQSNQLLAAIQQENAMTQLNGGANNTATTVGGFAPQAQPTMPNQSLSLPGYATVPTAQAGVTLPTGYPMTPQTYATTATPSYNLNAVTPNALAPGYNPYPVGS